MVVVVIGYGEFELVVEKSGVFDYDDGRRVLCMGGGKVSCGSTGGTCGRSHLPPRRL